MQAVAMILVGGVGQIHPNGTKTRGEPHLLLIGDPGTGKSQVGLQLSITAPCPRVEGSPRVASLELRRCISL